MNTPRPTHCIECSVRLTRHNRSSESTIGTDRDDVCNDCYDFWGWENTHSDEAHTEANTPDSECRVCIELGWLEERATFAPAPSKATGRHNTSHAGCTHPRTPAGRAACRKETALAAWLEREAEYIEQAALGNDYTPETVAD